MPAPSPARSKKFLATTFKALGTALLWVGTAILTKLQLAPTAQDWQGTLRELPLWSLILLILLLPAAWLAIELDYGMVNGAAEITTRVCLCYYLERHFGLDSEAPQAKGQRQQIVLVNRADLEAARAEIGENCGLDTGVSAPD